MDKLRVSFPDGYTTRVYGIGRVATRLVVGVCDPPGHAIGIDPGVNFGVTLIEGAAAYVMSGKLPRHEHRYDYGIEAIEFAKELAWISTSKLGTVEDAAFHKQMGQVGLAEVRFGFYYGLTQWIDNVSLIPPMSARKLAFGDGRAQAMDIWPLLNHNAADSVGIAIAALMSKEQENEADGLDG